MNLAPDGRLQEAPDPAAPPTAAAPDLGAMRARAP